MTRERILSGIKICSSEKILPKLVLLDFYSYDSGGMSRRDLQRKLESSQSKILTMEKTGQTIGFAILDMMEPGEIPEGFSDLSILPKLNKPWGYISAFTTVSNFQDKQTDLELLKALETQAMEQNCSFLCVPLTEDHPYKDPPYNVFSFFENDGFVKVGSINWVDPKGEKLPCRFYMKEISQMNESDN